MESFRVQDVRPQKGAIGDVVVFASLHVISAGAGCRRRRRRYLRPCYSPSVVVWRSASCPRKVEPSGRGVCCGWPDPTKMFGCTSSARAWCRRRRHRYLIC